MRLLRGIPVFHSIPTSQKNKWLFPPKQEMHLCISWMRQTPQIFVASSYKLSVFSSSKP